MEEALTAALMADASVAALIDERLAWSLRPQGKGLPALVLHQISGPRGYHMAGEDAVSPYRVQADCLADSAPGAKALARAVIALVSGATGLSGLDLIHVVGEFDDLERTGDSTTFRTALDLEVWA